MEQGSQNSTDDADIKALNNLYARAEIEGPQSRNAMRQRAALHIRARIAGDGPQEANVHHKLRTLATDPGAQCPTELAQALTMRHELQFAKGEFVADFNPDRLALPPLTPPPSATQHQNRTWILPSPLRRVLIDDFDRNFARPIIQPFRSNYHNFEPA